ncbi:MAG: DNA polymerase III subunit chi [Coxiellaceae bacterium]|jgi:DNA polymerase-3 subunit chi|nr:DNA polymerase III subunit chi [Coxiellaceae bacterium]
MIAKIAFYILNNDSSLKGRALYTCRIIEKAYFNNHKIYIHTSNQEEAQNFDLQLWTFSDISFIPHEIYSLNSNLDVPITIGYGEEITPEQKDILVNLTSEVVHSYQHFNHLIEVIPNDDQLKTLARQRFQIYQKAGCPIEVFKV